MLVSLYSTLVAIELALKDEIYAATGSWTSGHDVPNLIAPFDASLSSQLSTALGILRCTNKGGHNVAVSSAIYPGIRYLRHQSDFPNELFTTDQEISNAYQIAKQCVNLLRTFGKL
ncbi:MAG: hypothetical protein NTY98_09130, partial [Verrucomicrobia bacterium]|nr:hypothetical protein [Verrucomicrobiota bacterium]